MQSIGRYQASFWVKGRPLRCLNTQCRSILQANVKQARPTRTKRGVGCTRAESSGSSPQISWLTTTDESTTACRTDYEGIFVLAGGFLPDGSLPECVNRRLDASIDIQRLQSNDCPIVCLGGGTPHKPPIIDERGYAVHESTMCAKYLISRGVPQECILKEVSSYDTVGNAYFALTIHALPARWKRLAVVTSDFHMPRSQALFEDMSKLVKAMPGGGGDFEFSLDFFPVTDTGIFTDDVLVARKEREANSLKTWKKNVQQLKTLADLHMWLHQTHLCYSVARQSEFGRQGGVDDMALKSY